MRASTKKKPGNEQVNAPVRAACYCRISSDPKDKREGVTRQREDTAILCEVKGWTVVDYYIDNDRSASSGKERPEWERLLADIEAGKIDAVAAWDQDRVNRMMGDFERYKKLFVQRSILLATSNNGDIDLTTPSGVMMAQIKTAVSEHEISMMRIRMRRAARANAESGRPKWKRAFGYLGDTHQPDPVTAPLVREAYRLVLAGGSLNDVCRLWNGAGALTLNGKLWTAPQVSDFLKKARNAGLRSHTSRDMYSDEVRSEIVGKGNWPGLVDEDTWRAVQSLMSAPSRRPGPKAVRRHLLTGVVRCGKKDCGGLLSAAYAPDKSLIYICKGCRGVSIRAEHLEPMVYEIVAGRLMMPDAVDLLKAEQHDAAEAEQLREQAATLYRRMDNLAVELAQGLLTARQVRVATEVLEREVAAIESQQHDQERLRVFDGIALGDESAADAVRELSPDRFRSVMGVLGSATVMPVGKGGSTFKADRVVWEWAA